MALSMKEKAAGFSLNKTAKPLLNDRGHKSAVSMHVNSVYRDQALAEENVTLKSQLSAFEGARATRALDPKTVHRSEWANRNEAEFLTPEFREFEEEIAQAGGNVQPILVRLKRGVIDGQSPEYEIAYGHRRHQACLNRGLPVNAIIEESMDDKSLFEVMDRENRGRKNLSAWEQGCMYQGALDRGLYSSGRKLAEALGVNQSDLARALQLAKLPKDVVCAFPSPLDLQVRWAKPLADAIQKDPEIVLLNARNIVKNRETLTANEVFVRLIGRSMGGSINEIPISVNGSQVASFRTGPKGSATIEFVKGSMTPQKQADLLKSISEIFAAD